jgi:hypothetical protein
VLDQRETIVSEHVAWVEGDVVWFGAGAMPAQIGHYNTVAVGGNFRGMAVTHPIHHRG